MKITDILTQGSVEICVEISMVLGTLFLPKKFD